MLLHSRKAYKALVNDRLKELDEQMLKKRNEFEELCKEVDRIISGDMDDELLKVLEGPKK